MDVIKLLAKDDALIEVFEWWPARPRAVVQILHGMAEHARRYQNLAVALNQAGFAVIAHDHRGHGLIAAEHQQLGYFADNDGWQKLIDDARRVNDHARERNRELPMVLFGHSMGSFIAQATVVTQPKIADALVLSGSNLAGMAELSVGHWLARLEKWRKGAKQSSSLLRALSFGSYAKRFKPKRTEFDWLSRDPNEVDHYVIDPLCGFEVSTQLWIDVLGGLKALSSSSHFARFPKHLPIWILGGSVDPVGGERGLDRLHKAYQRAGIDHLKLTIYPDGRHEMFNDTIANQVTDDLLSWLNSTLSATTVAQDS